MPHQLLVVEDDDGIALPLVRTLEREGYAVHRVATGAEALQAARETDYDLVVLDLGLPDQDGLDVCRQIRAEGTTAAVLILTARGGELDLVVGLDVGADDYLTKPFALGELMARARALLRRTGGRPAMGSPAGGAGLLTAPPVEDLRIDDSARQVWVGAAEVPLTVKEFDLLAVLEGNRGNVLTRERLMTQVWDENWFGSTKTLDVTVARLRQKLEDNRAPVKVVTVRGVGFRLETALSGA